MPSDAPRPTNKINSANGKSPFVGAPLRLSVRARTIIKRTAVAMNSEKKHDTCVMYGSLIYGACQTNCGPSNDKLTAYVAKREAVAWVRM
jgi:hypothetical protein